MNFSFLTSEREMFADCLARDFTVQPGGMLSVKTGTGSIEATAARAEHDLRVEVERRIAAAHRHEADEKLKRLRLLFTQHGPDVHVESVFCGRMNELELLFRLTLPYNFNLMLRTAAGHISVRDFQGAADVETAAGSLRFADVQGSIHAITGAGDITVADARGPVRAQTTGGSINVQRVTGRLDVQTSGGNIHLAEIAGAVSATTAAGDIELRLPAAAAFDVDAQTSVGRVTTEFPTGEHGELSGTALRAKVNGGGPRLLLRTGAGSIFLRQL